MSHQHVSYLLVGGGVAAAAAAVAIREVDPAGSVLLVGQEISRPYQRSPLSKDYLQKLSRHQSAVPPFAAESGWFVEHQVRLQTNLRVERLDVNRRSALLANGTDISYDALLLATGASPRRLNVPGDDLPNVFTLRTLADADRLGRAIEQARREGMRFEGGRQVQGGLGAGGVGSQVHAARTGRGRAAVIGGGVLGVELAGALAEAGLAVELIVGAAHLWAHFAGESAGRLVSDHLQRWGVKVHAGRRAVAVEGDGRVQRVRLDDQTVVLADFAVAAVGSVANRDLLRGTPLAAEAAILADEACRTNVPGVFAAGDCAACFDPRFGKHRIVDHAEHARAAGHVAGRNMVGWIRGNAAPVERLGSVDHWTTTTAGLNAHIAGEPRAVDRRIIRRTGDPGERGSLIEIGVAADGRVAEVLVIESHDSASDRAAAMELLARRFRTAGHEEALRNVDQPLSTSMPE